MPDATTSSLAPLSARDLTSISRAEIADVTFAVRSCRFVLRGSNAAAGAALAAAALVVPDRINRAARSGEAATLKLGPDEYLVLARHYRHEAIEAALSDATAGRACGLVDVSGRDCGLILSGPKCEAVLNVGCPLPLELRAFPVDRATRTLFGKATIVLWRLSIDRFHIEVGRSFVPYVAGVMAEAIRSAETQ